MKRGLAAGLLLLSTAHASAQEQCRTDWSQCADNRELVENYQGWPSAQSACWDAGVAAIAPHGVVGPLPEEGNVGRFIAYNLGADYPKTGVARAIAPNFPYRKLTGERSATMLECVYDLRQKRILEIKFRTLKPK